ncbi:1-deoxy-D-xylulose 5-phosphate reductoisomerase [Litorimonas cladophorae]|uniref:1-deoxy-D-xylulose 5-phosphate reductoisomerase n=1 Tax=Litorimonas cladophorae TaxID=1220491 RepID=A0A918KDP2_9PROT|nr:1-deoxy-D-xylulose-5-phosphate reductoisomerase [Litorimonas cladophorae]GGX57691.1 1-deoxy-D-xylulose 5-phosphate reductoisomerase [Litorimonas cladophorae]
MTKRISVLGSTGSIGKSTLDIVRRSPVGTYQLVALTANRSVDEIVAQALEFQPEFVALADIEQEPALKAKLADTNIEIGVGPEALIEAARRRADFTMAAIIGSAGLEPTLAAVEQGQHVGLANKECLVCAGETFMAAVRRSGAKLLPVDSEHNAIFQVLEDDPKGVRRLILTASGGPFREASLEALGKVTRADALNHPVWSMGAKISIDSATLMNKGLELIEASWLFERPSAEIDVIVHPQSIIHSMVEYVDGSVLAQLGSPDMRTPIAYSMGWPARISAPVERLDFAKISGLTFFEPDTTKFPSLRLAREALEAGGQAPCVLNAANEQAVEAFLQGEISFLDIANVVESTLNAFVKFSSFGCAPDTVQAVLSLDKSARTTVDEQIVNL